MKAALLLITNFYCCVLAMASAPVQLKKGMVITASVKVLKKNYTITADTSLSVPVIVIRGHNITVDFNNAVLNGAVAGMAPDEFSGLAVYIEPGSTNITIRNLVVRGYQVGIMAKGVTNLTISGSDCSYNRRQRLHSNRLREDVSDWMSFHHNENDEWLRYGAAIYLRDCDYAVIRKNKVTGGQCALMMTGCDYGMITDNNFSFNSAIGIGMYRCNNNQVYRNNLDFNVRGFSFGKYYRGQDSAGILVFEQSSNNVFGWNSATHSGDGFFLWAGQTTMDSGEGGSNNNFLYRNDFSYAPTNGIEVTFSRNVITGNTIEGCDHGIWGGYSYLTSISGNSFAGNRVAIAIEHGQDISISANRFSKDREGIRLWARSSQPADWIYAQKRNTESRNYTIALNRFDSVQLVFNFARTSAIQPYQNKIFHAGQVLKTDSLTELLDEKGFNLVDSSFTDAQLKVIRKQMTLPRQQFPKGRKEMRINEWGPYNFSYPLLWLTDVDSSGIYHFEISGAAGKTPLVAAEGFHILTQRANEITARADSNEQYRSIWLKYEGKPYIDQFGNRKTKGSRFGYSEFDPRTSW
ncbi:MAG TPA: right-handed parallel beta-helix repeat-containing protein, partial [Chitinophagaceae bacterium]